MTGNNKILIENKKAFETVQELKDEYKIPSYEEFMETYESSEESELLTEAEYQDRVLHGSQYGSGNEQSRTAARNGTGIGIALLTFVCPPAGVSVAVGTAIAGTGIAVGANAMGDDEAANFGGELIGMGAMAAISGTSNLSAHAKKAGRGALAGPIIVASVILPTGYQNPLIQDSKILSPSQRKRAYRIVKNEALEYNVVAKDVREVEIKNPLGATKEAMVETILNLKNKPSLCLVDGKEKIVAEGVKTVSVIGGDRRSINIAAASIIAKVTRDTLMQKLHKKYPLYDWFGNKGYPNNTHLTAIFHHGICDLHRKTYEPIKSLLKPDCDKKKLREKYKL
ncbi:8201_t:CDS:2 [Funneliformis geosporum]|uniref:Ribonuclease n=1 Tax=Funneliformis geosporum TaxID=1117311 RepID=A0A9W4SKB1_9GLOM|nr:8201_t:CDS:2 [Funneliformis geosporum]